MVSVAGAKRQTGAARRSTLAAIVGLVLATMAGLLVPPSAGAVRLPSFYQVPPTIPKTPGTIIKYQRISVPGVSGTSYRIMYVSTNLKNQPVAVTGLAFVPRTPAPSGGYDIISWGHGTVGMAIQCAPSLDPSSSVIQVSELNLLLARNWMVVASDYRGLGTPGPLDYLVGELAARGTIDIVRAVHRWKAVKASPNYIVWGHSEGGQTALFSLHIGASYAPDVHLAGVVAGAPPSQFANIYAFLTTSPYRFYLFMAGVGYEHAYGPQAAPLNAILTPLAISLKPVVNKGCFSYLQSTIDKYSLAQIVKVNPFTIPAWKTLLSENDPQSFTNPVTAPLLIYQGSADEQIPAASSALLAAHLCTIGQDVERWIYPGQNHDSVIPVATPDFLQWMTDRFAGDPNPDPYQPVGQSGIEITTCPS